MKRPRFFLQADLTDGNNYRLDDSDARHIRDVLRMRAGEEIVLSDGAGKSFAAVLDVVGRSGVSCVVKGLLSEAVSSYPRITLVQGLPKGDKMDLIVQKGTELGLYGIIPLLSERVVVKLTEEKLFKRRERWQRIATEAAKQCRRTDVPLIGSPRAWPEALEELPQTAVALLPWEDEETETLKSFLRERHSPPEIFFFIGPEGGFSSSEVEEARKYGVRTVGLGPRILRTETAGIAVAAMLLFQWSDLGGA